MTKAGAVFGDIYKRQQWGDGSGGGSVPEHLHEYRWLVERLIRQHEVSRVLDIGCGYGYLAASIDWQGAEYIGIDVAAEPVLQAISVFPKGLMMMLDALTDQLPDADLVLLKEVTQHLDNSSIITLIEKLQRYPLVLHCSMISNAGTNYPIEMGETRGVDLTRSPFGLRCDHALDYEVGATRYLCQIWRPNA